MGARVYRLAGGLLVSVGVGLASLLHTQITDTDAQAAAAQQALLADQTVTVAAASPTPTPGTSPTAGGDPVPAYGQRVATMSFSRVIDGEYAAVEGTDGPALQRGPGRYRSTALPGQPGNFAVAGHRSTYGAPFADIGQLRDGDEVTVTDQHGDRFTYQVVDSQIVSPDDSWVIAPEPLGNGRPLLTPTTCHPRYSARQRLIVWAELQPWSEAGRSGRPEAERITPPAQSGVSTTAAHTIRLLPPRALSAAPAARWG